MTPKNSSPVIVSTSKDLLSSYGGASLPLEGKQMKTANEIVNELSERNPGKTFRAANDGNSVAFWNGEQWQPIAGAAITNQWYWIETQVLVNGKPAFDPSIYGAMPESK